MPARRDELSLELLNTVGTLVTVIIVATAAIAALVQLRHLRASNQINALIAVSAEFEAQRFRNALDLVRLRLASLMLSVVRGLPPPNIDDEAKEVRRSAILIGNHFEEIACS